MIRSLMDGDIYILFIPVIYMSAYVPRKFNIRKEKINKILLNSLIIISLVYNAFWIIKFHPFSK